MVCGPVGKPGLDSGLGKKIAFSKNSPVQSSPVQCRVQAGFSNWPWFVCLFSLKTGIHFAHFGLESGMVFEGTTGAYVSIPNEYANLKGFLRKLFVCVLT